MEPEPTPWREDAISSEFGDYSPMLLVKASVSRRSHGWDGDGLLLQHKHTFLDKNSGWRYNIFMDSDPFEEHFFKRIVQVSRGLPSCLISVVDPALLRGDKGFFSDISKAVETITTWTFSPARDSAPSLPWHQLSKEKKKKKEKFSVSCTASLLHLIDLSV